MLKSITIENFFGFSEAQTIHLNPEVNVLVGINGSGKSNFIKAIRLLYEGVHGMGLQKLIFEEWGGLDNVLNFSQSKKGGSKIIYEFDVQHNFYGRSLGNFSYEINISKKGIKDYWLSEKIYEATDKECIYLDIKNGRGFITKLINGDPFRHIIPIEKYKFNEKKFPENELVIKYCDTFDFFYLSHIIEYAYQINIYNYFDVLHSSIRVPKPFNFGKKLNANGENLVQVLNNLQSNHSLSYAKIEDALKIINPNFKNIHFSLIGSFQTMALVEKDLAKSVDMLHISDGTLRFLLLLSILYNPEPESEPQTICLDEPEIGLHPDMINTIAEGIKYAAQTGTQMFIATHSPLLLNAFELEDILIFEKDENNKSVVKTKSEEDFADWQGEFLAGQMWLRGQLGGTRW